MRSEDDLRAAFAAKTGDAPMAERVLRGVRAAESPRPPRRRWLVPAVGVAAAAAVGVPLALAASHSPHRNANADNRAGAPGAPRAPSVGGPGAGSVPSPSQQAAAGLGVCRPGDVTVTLRRDGDAGQLLVTSHGTPCRLARVPNLQWRNGSTTYGSTDEKATGGKAAPADLGVLPAAATAIAPVQWAGCGLPNGRVAYVDWGSGPVKVVVGAPTPTASCSRVPGPADPTLRVGPLTGLS